MKTPGEIEFFSTARNEADPEPEATVEQIRDDLRKIYELGIPIGPRHPLTKTEFDGLVFIHDADGQLVMYGPKEAYERIAKKLEEEGQ